MRLADSGARSGCWLPALFLFFFAPAGGVADSDSRLDPPAQSVAVAESVPRAWSSARRARVLRERRTRFGPLVVEMARIHGVRADLVHAIIEVESAYQPDAVSRAGAVGLMQLMPKTARRYGVDDATDPRENIAGGTAYLRDLDEQFGGDLLLVLAAYNAGEEAVERFGRSVPPYAETRAYVRRVVGLLRRSAPMLVIDDGLPTAPRSLVGRPAATQ